MKKIAVPFKCQLDIIKTYDEDGEFHVVGYVATSDLDLVGDVISREALEGSQNDLVEHSTVLFNHDDDAPIAKVIDQTLDDKGLMIDALVDQTAIIPATQTRVVDAIKQGILNKFSIRAKVIESAEEFIEALGRVANVIKRMLLIEASLVSIPANPEAKAMNWYIKKALEAEPPTPPPEPPPPPEPTKTLQDIEGDYFEIFGTQQGQDFTSFDMEYYRKLVTEKGWSVINTGLERLRKQYIERPELVEWATKMQQDLQIWVDGASKNPPREKGFPAPDTLRKEWSEFCTANEVTSETPANEATEKWTAFCVEKQYPHPFAYPYAMSDELVKIARFKVIRRELSSSDEPLFQSIGTALQDIAAVALADCVPYPGVQVEIPSFDLIKEYKTKKLDAEAKSKLINQHEITIANMQKKQTTLQKSFDDLQKQKAIPPEPKPRTVVRKGLVPNPDEENAPPTVEKNLNAELQGKSPEEQLRILVDK